MLARSFGVPVTSFRPVLVLTIVALSILVLVGCSSSSAEPVDDVPDVSFPAEITLYEGVLEANLGWTERHFEKAWNVDDRGDLIVYLVPTESDYNTAETLLGFVATELEPLGWEVDTEESFDEQVVMR